MKKYHKPKLFKHGDITRITKDDCSDQGKVTGSADSISCRYGSSF